MQCLVNSLIYLIAIMGIIFTTLTLYEMFGKDKEKSTYRIYSNSDKLNNKVEIVIKLNAVDEMEEKKIVELIKKNEEINLKELASSIIIEKSE